MAAGRSCVVKGCCNDRSVHFQGYCDYHGRSLHVSPLSSSSSSSPTSPSDGHAPLALASPRHSLGKVGANHQHQSSNSSPSNSPSPQHHLHHCSENQQSSSSSPKSHIHVHSRDNASHLRTSDHDHDHHSPNRSHENKDRHIPSLSVNRGLALKLAAATTADSEPPQQRQAQAIPEVSSSPRNGLGPALHASHGRKLSRGCGQQGGLTCVVADCTNPRAARGYCLAHSPAHSPASGPIGNPNSAAEDPPQQAAATVIQKMYKGYKARKSYDSLLVEQIMEEEKRREEEDRARELEVDKQLDRIAKRESLKRDSILLQAKPFLYDSSARLVQYAFRWRNRARQMKEQRLRAQTQAQPTNCQ